MEYEEILNDPIFSEYIEDKGIKPATIESYTHHMKKYCNVTGMTPEQLLNEARTEEDERIPLWNSQLKKHLKAFEVFLRNNKYTKKSQESAMGAVRNFYSWHDIRLPRPKRIQTPQTFETIRDIPSKRDIKKALGFANLKYKSIIVLMASSGMGSSEVRSLKVQDFLDSISEYFKKPINLPLNVDRIRDEAKDIVIVPIFNILRVKTSMPYTTYATPEAFNTILDYLEQYPPDNNECFLFPYTSRNQSKQITNNAFTTYFKRLNEKCGFGNVNTTVFFHSHALRKFFASTLINKDIKQFSIDAMLGHSVQDRTTGAYFKRNPTMIKDDYLKVLDDVTFLEEVDLKHLETKEYKELKELKKAEKSRNDEMKKMEQKLSDNEKTHREEVDKLMGLITDLYKEKGIDLNLPSKTIKDYDPGDEDDPL